MRSGSWLGRRRSRYRVARWRYQLPIPTRASKSESFFSLDCSPLLPSQIGRHLVVDVIGQREIAREIDFDSVAFPDGHRGHDVEKLLEDLRRRLRGALRESLAHKVGAGRVEGTSGPRLRDGS